MRPSKLVSIEVEYVAWEAEGIAITLQRSKTDQLGEEIVKAIPYGARPCSPATALRACCNAAGIAAGPMIRPISKWGELAATALHGGSINAILEACASLAQLDCVPDLSSYSLRRGKAIGATMEPPRVISRSLDGSRTTRPAAYYAR